MNYILQKEHHFCRTLIHAIEHKNDDLLSFNHSNIFCIFFPELYFMSIGSTRIYFMRRPTLYKTWANECSFCISCQLVVIMRVSIMCSLPENGEEVGGKCNKFYIKYIKIILFDFVQHNFARSYKISHRYHFH